MDKHTYCIIMAGGTGSRFWPISRAERPKQFIDILGLGKTFIQLTYDRFSRIVPRENIFVVTASRYYDLLLEQIPQIRKENILLEPFKRNTAPCIAYATYKLLARDPDSTVVVTPSDHLIVDEESFTSTVKATLDQAAGTSNLYTIGIEPTHPETNFGYIQANQAVCRKEGDFSFYQVKTFTEKPNAEMAQIFIDTGEFYWNSGIFIWNLKAIKAEMERCLPEVTTLFKGGEKYYDTPEEEQFILRIYEDCPSISIDYGVMEKTFSAWMIPASFGWSDVGTWGSIYERSRNKDANANIIKCGTSMIDDVKGSVIREDDPEKLVVVRGLENYMVIDVDDVLLICPRTDKAVKDIVTDLAMKDKADRYQ